MHMGTDVSYTTFGSPFGTLLLAATRNGIVSVGLPEADHGALLEKVGMRLSARTVRAPAMLEPARRQITEYFEGERDGFDLPLDRRLSDGFTRRALDAVAAIPYGSTASYTEIAAAAGSPRAHRAAGSACAGNPLPILIPCHRVLRSGGDLGGYGGGLPMKRALLALEQSYIMAAGAVKVAA